MEAAEQSGPRPVPRTPVGLRGSRLSPREAKVRVDVVAPVVIVRHLRSPDALRASKEVDRVLAHLRDDGVRALLLYVDEPLPPPSWGALREFRRLIAKGSALDYVALVLPETSGFAHTIATSAALQLIRATRLAGRLSFHASLLPACLWIGDMLEQGVDDVGIAERLDALGE